MTISPNRFSSARVRVGRASVLGIALLILGSSMLAQDALPDYKNPRLPIVQRVSDLLARMTLEEKCGRRGGARPERDGLLTSISASRP